MSIVIVPDSLRLAIEAALDSAYRVCPDAAVDHNAHYQVLLSYFDEHGELPDFQLAKQDPPPAEKV